MNKHVELKNHQREIYYFRLRLVVSIGFVLVLLAILLARFAYLQMVRHDHYQTLAESNRISVVPIVPNRGDRKSTRLNSSHITISYAVFWCTRWCTGKWMVTWCGRFFSVA